jgi:uncharacterized protein YwgA
MKTFKLPYDIVVEITYHDFGKFSGSITSNLHKHKHTTERQADVIESMILSHACNNIDISTDDYINGVNDTIQALANNS